jgi:hypothetical protein
MKKNTEVENLVQFAGTSYSKYTIKQYKKQEKICPQVAINMLGNITLQDYSYFLLTKSDLNLFIL